MYKQVSKPNNQNYIALLNKSSLANSIVVVVIVHFFQMDYNLVDLYHQIQHPVPSFLNVLSYFLLCTVGYNIM